MSNLSDVEVILETRAKDAARTIMECVEHKAKVYGLTRTGDIATLSNQYWGRLNAEIQCELSKLMKDE